MRRKNTDGQAGARQLLQAQLKKKTVGPAHAGLQNGTKEETMKEDDALKCAQGRVTPAGSWASSGDTREDFEARQGTHASLRHRARPPSDRSGYEGRQIQVC